MPSTILESASAIAQIISAIGIIFLGIQLVLYQQEMRDDHDRSRRENAITFLLEWAKGLDRNVSLTRKLVEQLDTEQIKALRDLEPFEISKDMRETVAACLDRDESSLEISGTTCRVPREFVKVIKWQTISYLNLLEAVLSAWRHNIADRKMIEEQFECLINPDAHHTMLEKYRGLAQGGFKALPAIHEFYQTVLKKRMDGERHIDPGKPPLGTGGTHPRSLSQRRSGSNEKIR